MGNSRQTDVNMIGGAHKTGQSGQIMLETVIVAASMLALVAIMGLLIYVFKEHGRRVLDLLASDYP
jgi:hypothetical protein